MQTLRTRIGTRNRAKRTPMMIAMAAGAATEYMLDPDKGKRRRRLAREKATSFMRRGAHSDGTELDPEADRARDTANSMAKPPRRRTA